MGALHRLLLSMSTLPSLTHTTTSLLIYSVVILVVGTYSLHALYLLLGHPLSRYPGPFPCKITPLYLVYQCRRLRRSAWVQSQHRKYGSIVRIAPNHVSINDPEAVAQVYGHKSGFTKGPFYEDKPVLFNTRDLAIHGRKRRYLNPAFSPKHLGEFEENMNTEIETMMEAFRRNVKDGRGRGSLDFCMWSNFLAFDVIADYAFGAPFGFLNTGRDDLNLINTIDRRGETFNALGHSPLFMRPWMRYFYLDRFWTDGLRAGSNLAAIGTASYEKRVAQEKSGHVADRKDLMSFLIKAKDPDTGLPLSSEEICAEAISFIVGGSDTTSSTMTNFVDFVSRDMRLQERLYRELREAFPGPLDENWVADFDTANRLPFLNAVVREVMRIRPTSSTGLERVTPKGGAIVAGNSLPESSFVSIQTLSIHYNPRVFPSPESFRPERWLEPDTSAMLESFIPFSVGPRSCIGRNFAWMEIFKTLATLFRTVEVRRAKDGPSEMREGFFNKIGECGVGLTLRD